MRPGVRQPLRQNSLGVRQGPGLEPPAGVDPIGRAKYPLYYLYRREAHAMELPQAILHDDPYPLRAMLIANGVSHGLLLVLLFLNRGRLL